MKIIKTKMPKLILKSKPRTGVLTEEQFKPLLALASKYQNNYFEWMKEEIGWFKDVKKRKSLQEYIDEEQI